MAVEYRVATRADVNALLPLVEAFAREQHAQVGVHELAEGFMQFAKSSLAQAVEHPAAVVMVAEEQGAIVGYAIGMLQEPPAIFRPELYTYISDLYVLPDRRRQGIGTGLVERVRGWGYLKGAFSLSMIVPPGSPAVGLGEKLGLRPIQVMMYAPGRA
ncbi:MAG: GNAT family N-acetyltransferase [Symbiobacterium sp.]|uniref:N-acetyltransferase family protein n=1 Tax=Symbiobacterium sp. TaxID=1971213 RepID=UPI003464D6EE